ncbi:cytidine deaminase [Mobiluncus mulieris 28-1]|uniref:Cytidine deaminase n=1 Tax=Mobiluncus mulieris TaxID=2052 RepID=A0A8G2HVY5_9ACTO|nr:cytidine deaminase [Mobiluncus mulieris]EEJ54397.1 putative cytidine deaminase [Mobiluncus mulieris ATCC 35243]EEZ90305.1 cytidine deaminase [Mobiluncus mulieris 28-1]EFN93103.1 cytidine deaminase [Mobiluncus mulieris FB024-16]MBB5846192.1 cytidine deaminase [Mobiluncus mulieris]MCU9996230.1 cytidine deaminase [Mobiluncus mulieris]
MIQQSDWDRLHEAAKEAQTHAYCPYSHYQVGAAGLTEAGDIVTGCNSENAAYGVGLCAECGMISQLTLRGGGKLVAFLCYGNHEALAPVLTVPCGRCRQLIREHASPELIIETPDGRKPFTEILPESFGPEYLNK